jgi:2-polyprenyl-6-methoxyphenol hydroxylase-like FAD-dependent oxidoreductase
MNKINTQVMIAGCGPVGLALANCLAKSVLIDSIVLLDRKVPDENR